MRSFAVVMTAVALALVSLTASYACGGMSTVTPPPFPGTAMSSPPGALSDMSSPGLNGGNGTTGTTTVGDPSQPGIPGVPGIPNNGTPGTNNPNDPYSTNPDDFFSTAGVDEVIL